MAKMPFFKFFPDEYLSDEKLRMCSLHARGLWLEILCYMHKSARRGYLQISGKPLSTDQISRLCGGVAKDTVSQLLRELTDVGVFSVDDTGFLFCRRMVRETEAFNGRVESGSKGGEKKAKVFSDGEGFAYAIMRSSDKAIKLGTSTKPKKRLGQLKTKFPDDTLEMVGCWGVSDMGGAEGCLHHHFRGRHSKGKWYSMSLADLAHIAEIIGGVGGGVLETPPKDTPKTPPKTPPQGPSLFLVLNSSSEGVRGMGKEETSFDESPAGLAQRFLFYAHPKLTCSCCTLEKVTATIESMVGAGFEIDRIAKSVDDRKTLDREERKRRGVDLSEHFWELKKRLQRERSSHEQPNGFRPNSRVGLAKGSLERIAAKAQRNCQAQTGEGERPAAG